MGDNRLDVRIIQRPQQQLTNLQVVASFKNPYAMASLGDSNIISKLQAIKSLIKILTKVSLALVSLYFSSGFIVSMINDFREKAANIESFYEQERDLCYNSYIENLCNTTNIPEIVQQCNEWYDCIKAPFPKTKASAFFEYMQDIKDTFFGTLTPRASAFFAFFCAVSLFLYCTN